eukprot:688810-Rhodomonas_salina.5
MSPARRPSEADSSPSKPLWFRCFNGSLCNASWNYAERPSYIGSMLDVIQPSIRERHSAGSREFAADCSKSMWNGAIQTVPFNGDTSLRAALATCSRSAPYTMHTITLAPACTSVLTASSASASVLPKTSSTETEISTPASLAALPISWARPLPHKSPKYRIAMLPHPSSCRHLTRPLAKR